jgi:hypothetical protein
MSHSFSFCFRNTHKYLCRLYRRLASLNDVLKATINVVLNTIYNIDILWGRRAHLFSNKVQCSWSLISIFLQLMTSTSRHVTSSDVTLYRLCGHVMSIDWSQSHHRKQMWCQMLIKLVIENEPLLVPIPIRIKTRSKLV